MAFPCAITGCNPKFSAVLEVVHSNGDPTQRLMSNREFTLIHQRNMEQPPVSGLPEMTNSSIGAACLVIRAYGHPV